MKLTKEEEALLRDDLEERADYITFDELRKLTVENDFFRKVQKTLIGRGTKLVVGPRGCGKTHMMRFAQLTCADKKKLPFAVYVSFNRYYRLEPMLHAKSNAIRLFQQWTLANTVSATLFALELFESEERAKDFAAASSLDPIVLQELVARLETSSPLDAEQEALAARLTVADATRILDAATTFAGRPRCVLLLDDAALTLTPEYLVEFFDVVRAIKTAKISPKASIYPGTTDFGPRFHAVHESEEVAVWLSPQDDGYESMMMGIASARFPEIMDEPTAAHKQLCFAAFGVPRAYLAMMRQLGQSTARTQVALTQTIDDHMTARIAEFESLGKKVPRFESLVSVGSTFFRQAVEELATANKEIRSNHKQLLLGLADQDDPLTNRMLSLLLEAGLLYEHQKVAHGDDRTYRRFTPHLAALMRQRAFSGGGRGVSPSQVVDFLDRPQAKHPLRRSVETLLPESERQRIRLSLPPCKKCGADRMSEGQKFCHECGAELLSASTFANYLDFPLIDIPGFTPWQRDRVQKATGLRTVGDLLAYRDPGSELRKIPWVGERRARTMLDLVNAHVDEFFS